MTNLLLVALTVVLVGCSTAHRTVTPAADSDLSGRWTGTWKGTGLLASFREDTVTLDLAQRGDLAYGRFVLDGAGAAESVPVDLRYAGLWGLKVRARISKDRVTLRHDTGGHPFYVDLKRTADGAHLYGTVRDSYPPVAIVLSRASDGAAPQAAMAPPPPETPGPNVVVIGPQQKDEAPARQEGFVGVADLAPIHFDFDKADIRKDAMDTLTGHITWLKNHGDALVLIEGHCDERGTDEYNVALGERRAKSVSELLLAEGIPAERITVTSFGRERPVCMSSNEDCRMQNRRAEFRIKTR